MGAGERRATPSLKHYTLLDESFHTCENIILFPVQKVGL